MNFNTAILLLYQFLARPIRIISTKNFIQNRVLPGNITQELVKANTPYHNFLTIVISQNATYTGVAINPGVLVSHPAAVEHDDLVVFKMERTACRKLNVIFSLESEDKVGIIGVEDSIGSEVRYIPYYVDVSEMECIAVGVQHLPVSIVVDIEYGVEGPNAKNYDAIVCGNDGLAGILIEEYDMMVFRLIDEIKTLADTARRRNELEVYREIMESLRDKVNNSLKIAVRKMKDSASHTEVNWTVTLINVLVFRVFVILG